MTDMLAITVLIIDDCPADRDACRCFLELHGDFNYTFVEADSAEIGLQYCKEIQLDCVLLDYLLPDMSGEDFLSHWQKIHEERRPPVVIVTGHGNENIAVACLKLGAVDYITKSDPNPDTLFRAVQNAIRVAQLRADLAEQQRQRHLIEQELRESEARFRLLVDSVKDYAIVMLDVRGRISSWNAGARHIFNYHEREVIGHSFAMLFVAEKALSSAVAQKDLQLALQYGRLCDNRWYVGKGCNRLWASTELTAVRDSIGQLHGYAWVVRNIGRQRISSPSLVPRESLSAQASLLAASGQVLGGTDNRRHAFLGVEA